MGGRRLKGKEVMMMRDWVEHQCAEGEHAVVETRNGPEKRNDAEIGAGGGMPDEFM